jgi:hypothetical protein
MNAIAAVVEEPIELPEPEPPMRTTIYLPGQLARRLRLLKHNINVSRVCVTALEQEIDRYIAELEHELAELRGEWR